MFKTWKDGEEKERVVGDAGKEICAEGGIAVAEPSEANTETPLHRAFRGQRTRILCRRVSLSLKSGSLQFSGI